MTEPNANADVNGRHERSHERGAHSAEEPRVVVRDRRRIDPRTGEVRPPVPAEPGAGPEPGRSTGRHAAEEPRPPAADEVPADIVDTADTAGQHAADPQAPDQQVADQQASDQRVAELRGLLDERTADLQRLTAEYANYRKRMDRDREVAATNAKAGLASDLLAVLDDLERAEAHGDLTGAFKSVADRLVATLQKAGLTPFGHEGEEFDPTVHEAVQHETSPDVSGPTVTAVLRRGYRFGERTIRAALVVVTDHEPAAEPTPPEEPAEPSADQH